MNTGIFLEKLSMKVKKYLALPIEVVFMGPHTLECTISNTLVALVSLLLGNGCIAWLQYKPYM